MVELPEGRPFVLGRVQGADLVVRDARASRRHAELDRGGRRRCGCATSTRRTARSSTASRCRRPRCATASASAIGDVAIAVLAAEPAVTGAPIAEPVRPPRTPTGARRGRWSAGWSSTARAAAGGSRTRPSRSPRRPSPRSPPCAAHGGESDEERAADTVRAVAPATVRVDARGGGAGGGQRHGLGPRATGCVVTAAHVVNLGTEVRVGTGRAGRDRRRRAVRGPRAAARARRRRGAPLALAAGAGGAGRVGPRARLPRGRAWPGEPLLHPRRGLRGAHAVPRPGARRPRLPRRDPTDTALTRASRAGRSSTSTAA